MELQYNLKYEECYELMNKHYFTINFQIYTDPPVQEHIQAVCDNIDAWAMWIAPPVFVLFNVAYWISYQHSDHEGKCH